MPEGYLEISTDPSGHEGERMQGKECVTGFSCPIKIKLILPKDCVLDEEALKKRIEDNGAQMFMGLCDACPWFRGKGRR